MKIKYISDADDFRGLICDGALFGGHTYCSVIYGYDFFYNYQEFYPEKNFSKWIDFSGRRVGVYGRLDGISPESGVGVLFFESNGLPCDFFGVDEYNTSGIVVFNNKALVGDCSEEDGSVINVYSDLDGSPEKIISGVAISESFLSNDHLFAYDQYMSVATCINYDMSVLWLRKFANKDPICVRSAFFDYNDSVILRLGKLEERNIDGQVVSLDKTTGETQWAKDINFYIDHCSVIGGKIYLSSIKGHQYSVIDAHNGEVILEGKIQYDSERELKNLGPLWSDSGFLFLFVGKNLLRIMDEETGEIVQDLNLPENSDFAFPANKKPIFHGDYVYVPVVNSGGIERFSAYGGVLIISREELEGRGPYAIEFEDKGAVGYKAVPDGRTEYYEVDVAYEELGDVLRFGQIEIKLVAQKYSYNRWGNLADNWRTRINEKFDGRIVLNIDKEKLSNPDEGKFDLMVKLFNDYFKEGFRAPANKKKPLTLSWQYK